MRLLLDTHVLLWWLSDDRRLGASARDLIANPDHTVHVSAASVWEISIKKKLGKLKAPKGLDQVIIDAGFEALEITLRHADRAGALKAVHRDPVDRMLVAQSTLESLTLLSADPVFRHYGVNIIDATR